MDDISGGNEKQVSPGMTEIVNRNIHALIEHRKQEDAKTTLHEKAVDHITRFAGSLASVYMHIGIFAAWILWNKGVIGLKPFDPTLLLLGVATTLEAIFLSTFVLISQNRMNVHADKRADLHLQVGLLAEHEITRIITLVTAIAKKMDIEGADHPALDELAKDVQPEKVLDTIEKHKEDSEKK